MMRTEGGAQKVRTRPVKEISWNDLRPLSLGLPYVAKNFGLYKTRSALLLGMYHGAFSFAPWIGLAYYIYVNYW